MPLKSLRFAPGVVRETTNYANGGSERVGWWDCDKVRFRAGLPETIGGWVKASATQIYGLIRSLFTWSLLNGDQLVAIGSERTINLLAKPGLFDITPIAQESAPGAMLEQLRGVTGTSILVMPILTGARFSDVITISNPGPGPGGHPTEAEMEFPWVLIDATPFYPAFDPATQMAVDLAGRGVSPFTSALPFGTASTVIRLYASSPTINASTLVGWGGGEWGLGPWGGNVSGVPSPDTLVRAQPPVVSFDNFGQDLLFCWRNGPLYIWKPEYGYDATGLGENGRGVEISTLVGANAVPVSAYEVMVAEQTRVVMAFGTNSLGPGGTPAAFDPLLVRWSAQENYLDWLPTSTNSAGELHLQSGSIFVTATKTRREILAWTDRSLNSVQFIGGDLVFGIEVMGRGISIAGPNAKIAIDDDVYWMGTDQFYHYSGSVATMPCAVQEYVFGNFNLSNAWKVTCAYEPAFNEVKWFYPSLDSTNITGENDRYVSVNRTDGSWSIGKLARSAWMHRAIQGRSVGGAPDGYLYIHEVGLNDGSTDPATPLAPYITSSPFEVGEGDQFMTIWRMIPDITFRPRPSVPSDPIPQAYFTFEAMEEPGSGVGIAKENRVVRTATATVPVESFTKLAYLRLRSRMARFTVSSRDLNVGWRLGVPRVDSRPDGRR